LLEPQRQSLTALPPGVTEFGMTPNSAHVRIAALFGAFAVILGAFGAHALNGVLVANGTLEVWKTASQYHLIHALALLVLGLVGGTEKLAIWSWRCLALGTVIFSGSLYVLALTNIKQLGAITPIGGLLMIVGWLLVAFRSWR